MTTIKRVWAGETVEYQTDGFGGLDADLSGNAWVDLATVDLETAGHELVIGQLRVDFAATPTDDVEFRIVGSLDGVNFDQVASAIRSISNDTDQNQGNLRAYDWPHVKFQARMSGATDAADVELTIDKSNWQSV